MLTVYRALSIPPAKDMFFQVIIATCFGRNVSAPTTPVRMSHMVRSRTSTPRRSVRVGKSRSNLIAYKKTTKLIRKCPKVCRGVFVDVDKYN